MKHRLTTLLLAAILLLPACGRAQTPALRHEADVSYGEADHQPLRLDLWRPADDRRLPAVVFIHGGGWSAGDKNDFAGLAQGLAAHGYVCFSINYRLVKAPANPWPACYDDCQRAVRWVRAHAADYNLDPDKLGVLGASAGGHLVAMLGATDTRDNSDADLAKFSSRPTCVVDLFGPVDFTADLTVVGQAGPWVVALVKGLLQGKTKDEAPDLYKAASPIFHIDAATVPFLIFQGGKDPLVSPTQSRSLDAALRAAGRPSTLIEFPEEGHGFVQKANLETFVKQTLAFFDHWLKGQPLPTPEAPK